MSGAGLEMVIAIANPFALETMDLVQKLYILRAVRSGLSPLSCYVS